MSTTITVATCQTAGCENEGLPVPLVDASDRIVCGPCGVDIDDKQASDRPWDELLAEFHAAADAKHGAQ